MKRFFAFLKTELKLSVRDMNMPIFAVMMPLVIFVILGIIYGAKPAYDGAGYTFLEQSFGAAGAIAICASGLMGLPLAVSGLRELKILKRLRVTPAGPVFILGVELSMYIVYCAVSLVTLSASALLWGVRLRGSIWAFLGSWVLTMLSTLSIGMLAGGVAKDTKQASVIASILYFPMLVFSGTTLPVGVMVGVAALCVGMAVRFSAGSRVLPRQAPCFFWRWPPAGPFSRPHASYLRKEARCRAAAKKLLWIAALRRSSTERPRSLSLPRGSRLKIQRKSESAYGYVSTLFLYLIAVGFDSYTTI